MKKVFSIFLIGSMLCFAGNIKAQDASEGGFLEHGGIGLNVNFLKGYGISAHLSLLPTLKARVGLNYFGLGIIPTILGSTDFHANDYDFKTTGIGEETVDGKITKINLAMINGSILADWYPFGGNSVFSITGGCYIGADRVNVAGDAHNDFSYQNIQIKTNNDGTFKGYIQMGNIIKPYIGIGLGKTIPNSRVGFRWDLGVVYQGKPSFYSDNAKGGKFNADEIDKEGMGDGYNAVYNAVTMPIFPQMQFTLSYRIF
ncbi:MAG: hypothetical protein FWF72_03080 [Paludibacter sp.]|nr:hypothetical protein [Paludibacter sp.]